MDSKKPLYLSQHAKTKMTERQVAFEMVQETMQKGTHRPAKYGRMVAEKEIGNAKVRVVYSETKDAYFVVTVTRG